MSGAGPRGWPPLQPPQLQQWWWGTRPPPSGDIASTTPAPPVRIGDAERDQAIAELGDHFAAGRLLREELDERVDQALHARFSTDLDPLFVDLPAAVPAAAPALGGSGRALGGPPPWAPVMWMLPVLVVAAVAGEVVLHAPFLLWGLVWMAVVLRVTGRRGLHRRWVPQDQDLGRSLRS